LREHVEHGEGVAVVVDRVGHGLEIVPAARCQRARCSSVLRGPSSMSSTS
jgi:hypothetical protein